jgi:hypothetical protein
MTYFYETIPFLVYYVLIKGSRVQGTVISHKQKATLKEAYKKKLLLPLNLRPKKTRTIRRRLTKIQVHL